MNPKQKTYDSYDYTIKMLKVSESLYHQQNLFLIKTRKSPYMGNSNSSSGVFKKSKEDPVNSYFKTKNNYYLQNKIYSIGKKPPKPILNIEFICNDKKKKEFNLKMKEVRKQTIQRENDEMGKRIDNLRSFISARELDKDYNGDHQKLVRKLQKVSNGKLLLPRITYRNNTIGNSNNQTHHQRNMTEVSIDHKKNKKEFQTIS